MTELYNKQNYSSKTIETYEFLAAYFVDIFYNHLYNEAKKLKINNSCASVTEGYKHTLNAFIKGLNNAKLYKKYIIGIHHYYIAIGFASISFTKCVDRVTQEFIPEDYFNSLTSTQKMGVLRLILNSSIKQFITILVKEHLKKIIDFHDEKDNARILQDSMIDCFILERESMYQRFVLSYNNDNNINTKLINNMQNDIKKLVKEKLILKKKYDHLAKMYMNIKKKEEKVIETNNELLSKINENKEREREREIEIENQTYENKLIEAREREIENQTYENKLIEAREIERESQTYENKLIEAKERERESQTYDSKLIDVNKSEKLIHNSKPKSVKYIEVNDSNLGNLINNNIVDEYVMESETTLHDFL